MLSCKNLKKETKENLKDKIFIKVHIIMFIGCHVVGAGQAPEKFLAALAVLGATSILNLHLLGSSKAAPEAKSMF